MDYIYVVTEEHYEDSVILGVYTSMSRLRRDFPQKKDDSEPAVNGIMYIGTSDIRIAKYCVNSTIKCARTVCKSNHDNCKHSQTGLYYCESCAIKINRACDNMNLIDIPRLKKVCSNGEPEPCNCAMH